MSSPKCPVVDVSTAVCVEEDKAVIAAAEAEMRDATTVGNLIVSVPVKVKANPSGPDSFIFGFPEVEAKYELVETDDDDDENEEDDGQDDEGGENYEDEEEGEADDGDEEGEEDESDAENEGDSDANMPSYGSDGEEESDAENEGDSDEDMPSEEESDAENEEEDVKCQEDKNPDMKNKVVCDVDDDSVIFLEEIITVE